MQTKQFLGRGWTIERVMEIEHTGKKMLRVYLEKNPKWEKNIGAENQPHDFFLFILIRYLFFCFRLCLACGKKTKKNVCFIQRLIWITLAVSFPCQTLSLSILVGSHSARMYYFLIDMRALMQCASCFLFCAVCCLVWFWLMCIFCCLFLSCSLLLLFSV